MPLAHTPMSSLMKGVFWLVALNALAGAGALMFFPTQTETLFFWEIKPALNAALFGALYFGGAVIVAWVTYQGQWEGARFLIPVLVAAGIFISITTLLHLERFAPGLKLFYWLAIYIGAPLLALLFYLQHERQGRGQWGVQTAVTPVTRWLATILGGMLLVLGVGLLIWPEMAIPHWPWPMTPLMLRIFASWFSAFGVGLLWFQVEREWQRLQHVAHLMMAAAGLDLLMVVVHRNDLTGSALSVGVYCFHLALFGLVGLLMHWLQRRGHPTP